MTTITAAVARDHKAPLTLEQLELDEIRDDEVRVRMVATGICHTDAVVRDGLAPTPLPAVLGHEGTGIVEQVGKAITTVSPGDHVVLAAAYCATCRQCRAGRMAYCENLFAQDFGGRRTDGSTSLTGADGDADLVALLRAVVLLHLRERRREQPRPRRPVGAAGDPRPARLRHQHRRRLGPQRAPPPGRIVVRRHRSRRRRSRRGHGRPRRRLHHDHRGRSARLPARAGPRDRRHPHRQLPLDATCPTSWRRSPAARVSTTSSTPPACRPWSARSRRGRDRRHPGARGSRAPRHAAAIDIDIPSLVKGWTFKTIVQGSSVPQVFIPRLVELWKQGRFPLDKLVKTYKLDDINTAFDDSESGATVKPVVVF